MEALGKGLSGLRYKWHKTFIHSSKYRTQQAAEIVARELSGLDLKPSELIWSCAYDVSCKPHFGLFFAVCSLEDACLFSEPVYGLGKDRWNNKGHSASEPLLV